MRLLVVAIPIIQAAACILIWSGCGSIPMEDCERRCRSQELHDSVLAECDEVPVTDYTSPGKCQLAENIRYHGCRSRCE